MWGVCRVRVTDIKKPTRNIRLKEDTDVQGEIFGQYPDRLGEGFKQHPIGTDEGDFYASQAFS